MLDTQKDLLTDELVNINQIPRKKLLPGWIKVFAWIFLVMGFLVPFVLVAGFLGYSIELSLYGIETRDAYSVAGVLITGIYLIKGVTAFGLLKEKDWAVKFAIADAIIGNVICVFIMIYYPNAFYRLELIALIPYLVRMIKIKPDWENYIDIAAD